MKNYIIMSISSILKTTEQQSYCSFILDITLKERETKEKGHDISHDKHNSLCKMIKSKKCIQQITRTRLKQNYDHLLLYTCMQKQ